MATAQFFMLAKDPARRPRDAGVVRAAVAGMQAGVIVSHQPAEHDSYRLTVHEQELVSVVLATRSRSGMAAAMR